MVFEFRNEAPGEFARCLALVGRNPFPNAPPKYIRAQLYEYHFTDMATRRATGRWWRREYKGAWFPPLTLPDNNPGIKPGQKSAQGLFLNRETKHTKRQPVRLALP